MKEFFDVTLLAALQGVAEFLPISSSGHLVIGQYLLGINEPGLRLDIFLHLGTLIAVFVYYARRVAGVLSGMCAFDDVQRRNEAWGFAIRIFVSTLPAVVVYLIFNDPIEELFENARMVGALLMFTGAVLFGTRVLPRGKKDINMLRALLMGLGQAVALLPGVSRSGMTLASARACGVAPEASAEFSFLMSAPLIAGAAFLELLKSFRADAPEQLSWGVTLWGALVAAVVGYFSLALLVRTLKGKRFWLFGVYCFAAGLFTICFCG